MVDIKLEKPVQFLNKTYDVISLRKFTAQEHIEASKVYSDKPTQKEEEEFYLSLVIASSGLPRQLFEIMEFDDYYAVRVVIEHFLALALKRRIEVQKMLASSTTNP